MKTLDDVARSALSVPGVASAAIFVRQPGSTDLALAAAAGIEGPALDGLVVAVRSRRHPVAIALTGSGASFNVRPMDPGGPALRSDLPLGGRGVLALAHEPPLDPAAQRAVEALARDAELLIVGPTPGDAPAG